MARNSNDKLRIHVDVEISSAALQAIVAYAKQTVRKDAQGAYHIDTADQVSEVITRFLEENGVEDYAPNLTSAGSTSS